MLGKLKQKICGSIMWRNSLLMIMMFFIILTMKAQAPAPSQTKSHTPHKVKVMTQQERLAQRKAESAKNDTLKFPLFNGVYIGADLYGIGNHFFGSHYDSYEVSADVNLKNRFFPVFELGYGKTDYTKNGSTYTASAPYFRIGMNYKIKHKTKSESHLFVGFRYGMSKFNYSINTAGLTDGIWGGTVPLKIDNASTTAMWYELVCGIRVHVYKNLMMGWTVRYCTRIKANGTSEGAPWYIPGFGQNRNNNYGFTYSIYYKLPY